MTDDEKWFDILAGRAAANPDDPEQTEASALRAAILKRHAAQAPAAVDLAELQRFKQKLRNQNLLPARPRHARVPRWLSMAAAVTLVLGLGLMLRQQLVPPEQDYETSRGEQNQNTVRVADAKQAAAKLQHDLAALGITPRITQGTHSARVEAYVPFEREAEVNALLAPYKVSLNKDGQLLLTFDSAPRK